MPNLNNIIKSPEFDALMKFIKKYILLLVIVKFINIAFNMNFPIIIHYTGITNGYYINISYLLLEYIFNSIYIYFIYKDMKKEGLFNNLILILTFFIGFFGVVMFLISLSYKYLINLKSNHNERTY